LDLIQVKTETKKPRPSVYILFVQNTTWMNQVPLLSAVEKNLSLWFLKLPTQLVRLILVIICVRQWQ